MAFYDVVVFDVLFGHLVLLASGTDAGCLMTFRACE